METLIVNIKNKTEGEKIKGFLSALKTQFKVIEDFDDKVLAEMMEEGKNEGRMSKTEEETFFSQFRF